jgi:hypothetical protein
LEPRRKGDKITPTGEVYALGKDEILLSEAVRREEDPYVAAANDTADHVT